MILLTILISDHSDLSQDDGVLRLGKSKGKSMSAFENPEGVLNASQEFELTLNDRLVMIDTAYARQDRAACAYFIEDLYKHFDTLHGS